MERSRTPGVIQGDVPLHDISASPSVELSQLLTPSLPDDKLQAEMSLDFDASCNAHDSVLDSSFPLGQETDVSMGDDECLDLSVTPSFETGLSDYAPTCFDSSTITHSIHTHPVCAVSESVSSFIGKETYTNRSRQESVVGAQILNASPFILGNTSAGNFVNAVLGNLQSQCSGVLQPAPSIISVAPGIFVLNTLGTPGIIDLPLRTNLALNDPSIGVSSAFQTAVTLAHSNLENQLLQNRDPGKINSFIPSNLIKLEIRTVPFSQPFPLVTSNDSSMVLPSNTNFPISLTPDTYSENISSSTYLAFDGNLTMPSGIHADSLVQLENRNFTLEQTYCHEEKVCDITKMCVQTDQCSDSIIKDKKSSAGGDGKFDNTIMENIIQDGLTESPDLSASSLMCSVDNSLWSDVSRFCTFSSKSNSGNTRNIQEIKEPVSASYSAKHTQTEVHNEEKVQLMETILNPSSCEMTADSPAGINTHFKVKGLASLVSYIENSQSSELNSASSAEGSCSQIGTDMGRDAPVSSSVEEKEADTSSEQQLWDVCSSGETQQPAGTVAASNPYNCNTLMENTDEDKNNSVVVVENKNCELNSDISKEDLPSLDSTSQHPINVQEMSADDDKTSNSTGKARAIIHETSNLTGKARTVIRETSNLTGKARAIIHETSESTGKARAVIHETSNSTGKAQAVIHETSNSTGEARAVIHETSSSTGKARAIIHKTSNSTGKARAVIHEKSNSTGKARAVIHETSNWTGKARAVIRETSNSTGKARTVIHETSNLTGKAQAIIHGTSNSTGEAQTVIHETSNLTGKVRAVIHETSNSTGKVQTVIHEKSSTSSTVPTKPDATAGSNDPITCTLVSGGQDDPTDQTDQESGGQDGDQMTESNVSECDLCNATFTRPGNYKRHLKLHDFKHWVGSRRSADITLDDVSGCHVRSLYTMLAYICLCFVLFQRFDSY